jgi:hypothetical protein
MLCDTAFVKAIFFALAVAASVAAPSFAQNISVGVRGGLPFTDALSVARSQNFSFHSEHPQFALGPTFEVRLPLGLGFHVDALYRRIALTGSGQTGAALNVLDGKNSFSFWQFPVMAKLRLGVGPFRPFVSAGPSFSKLSGVGDAANCVIRLAGNSCVGRVLKSFGTGVAVGAGLDAKLPIIRLAPEVRYTRLGANFFEGGAGASLASQRNQVELLLGVTF